LAFNLAPPPPLLMPPLLMSPPILSDNAIHAQKEAEERIEMKNIGWNMLEHSKIKNSFWENLE
jgi:hypothetical protein